MPTPSPALPTMRADTFRATHRASVVAILGADAPPVEAKGSRFYNVDRWTVRFLTARMCKWAKENPGCVPLRSDVTAWVNDANAEALPGHRRVIVTAAIPSELTVRVAMALMGGGYHEALHTRYSARRNLRVSEIADVVLPRWAIVPD